ncbi:MAG TPA: DUF5996 family protein [Candidatus Acidoferrales bacterium]|nr:DUF5996 family protein [Candidatus Acidoferrales bacterium]
MPSEATASRLSKEEAWPALPLAEWSATRDTLHMWTQIVGKLRLALSPHVNHWWEVPLYVSARGLGTSPIPYRLGIFEAEFDFIDHVLRFVTSRGETKTMPLAPRSVADFYNEFKATTAQLGIDPKLWPMPVEIPDPIRFDQDTVHASYDPAYANRFWRILVSVDSICKEFRARFIGKASPVHFFWGSFDLAVSRFSGRRAPERPGADAITKDAYSHEETSAGWWPGNGGFDAPMFYAYAAPEPAGFREAPVRPAQAYYSAKLGEFLLPYNDVREANDPKAALMDFLQSTYEVGATLGKWDRAALERQA